MNAMKYAAFATDYDGTLARDGKVDEATFAALGRVRAAGVRLLLVTGRELTDLANTFSGQAMFDRIVAENGAVLFAPETGRVRTLAAPPPPEMLAMLTSQRVPLSVGHSIVATVKPHEHAVLCAIRDLGIEWHLIFNKGSVMALPAGVTKATGLLPALEELGVRPEQTIGIGDAENDHAFLCACGLSAAVANAVPSLKAEADIVTEGARGEGVVELIGRLLAGDLDRVSRRVGERVT